MGTSAIFGMILICGTVIGGFSYFLTIAIRNEQKANDEK